MLEANYLSQSKAGKKQGRWKGGVGWGGVCFEH